MRALALIGGLGLLLSCLQPARADTAAPPVAAAEDRTELTVSSMPGFLLLVDDKPVGHLPLDGPLLLSSGPHRFELERQGHHYASDVLAIPQGRIAELSLSPGSRGTAIAVLSLTPMVLLALQGGRAVEETVQALRAAVQEGARAEHSALVPAARVAALQRDRAADCLAALDCQLSIAVAAEARMILRLELPAVEAAAPAGSGGPLRTLRGEVVDVSTGQSAAAAEQPCGSNDAQLTEAAQQLTRQLLASAAKLGKGILIVTSRPAGAQVTIDGRPRGVTPFEGPSLPGRRELVLAKPEHAPHRTQVEVIPGQAIELSAELTQLSPAPAPAPAPAATPAPAAPPPRHRPRWRLVTGGIAIGLGAVITGLGAYAITQDGACADPTPRTVGNCSYIYATSEIGGGGLAVGLSLAAVGAVLIAVPGPRTPHDDGVRK